MNILYFLLATVLFAIVWMIYLFLNNMVDKMQSGLLQEAAGIALSFALLSSIMLILYYHAVSFSMGLIAIAIIGSIVYAIRSAIRGAIKQSSGN